MGIFLLEMQTPQHTLAGHRLVVLDKMDVNACFLHIPQAVGLHKVAPVVAVDSGGDDAEAFNTAQIFFNSNLSHYAISFR